MKNKNHKQTTEAQLKRMKEYAEKTRESFWNTSKQIDYLSCDAKTHLRVDGYSGANATVVA